MFAQELLPLCLGQGGRIVSSIFHSSIRWDKKARRSFLLLFLLSSSACLSPASEGSNDSSSTPVTPSARTRESNESASPARATTITSAATSTSSTLPSGARAAQIIFAAKYPTGSFDTPPASGTRPVPGQGLQAARVFNPDGTLLAAGGPTSTSWPKWLSSFEVTVSGATNTSAPNAQCAKFTSAAESTANCRPGFRKNGAGATNQNCGGPTDYYRTSEIDCAYDSSATSNTQDGTGGPSDGVTIRATFSRNSANLGLGENIMAVLEYAASGLNAAAYDPSTCFSAGSVDPGRCSDMHWSVFLKHNVYEIVQPFMMLVPPVTGFIDPNTGAAPGAGSATFLSRQFILPLASDSQLSVFQISRIKSLPKNATDFTSTCSSSNTPRCVGMIFRKLTFYRM